MPAVIQLEAKLKPITLHPPLPSSGATFLNPGHPHLLCLRDSKHSGILTELICSLEALQSPVSQTRLATASHLLPVFSLEHTMGNTELHGYQLMKPLSLSYPTVSKVQLLECSNPVSLGWGQWRKSEPRKKLL